MTKHYVTNTELAQLAVSAAALVGELLPGRSPLRVFPVPRGGIPAALAILAASTGGGMLVDKPEDCDVIVDDIIDSGRTRDKYRVYEKPFVALIDKALLRYDPLIRKWIVFPWEATEEKDDSFSDNITRLLQFIGEDPKRGGLLETPKRVEKAWLEYTEGYRQDPAHCFKTFDDGAEGYDGMVVMRNIRFYSHCEHHLAPFFGSVHIGYIPHDGKIIGLSKLVQLVNVFAHRLQVQERLTSQIANALAEYLSPDVAVITDARHFCIESRGKRSCGQSTPMSAVRGAFTEQACRAEFLQLIKL